MVQIHAPLFSAPLVVHLQAQKGPVVYGPRSHGASQSENVIG